jgi:hypothetical protein
MRARRIPALVALALGVLAPAAARAEELEERATLSHLGSVQRHTRFGLGLRSQWVPNDGYDPFARSNYLAAWTFEGSHVLYARRRLSLAAGALIDLGGSSSEARGAETHLGAHRFLVPVEGRYHVTPWLAGFARIAPGAMYMTASISEASAGQKLDDAGFVFAADASLGAAFLFDSRRNPDGRPPRLWATGEWGYGWTTSRRWRFLPDDGDKVTGRSAPADLGSVAFRGTFFRLGLALSF